MEQPKQKTILVVSPADLSQGFQFVANYEGRTFLVTVPHQVKEGETFEAPHPDMQTKGQLTQNQGVNDDVLCKVACCCNAAPCCWPDGCCPDGCCPDGCCPNGNCGEQFEGCCFHYDFRQSNAIQAKMELLMNGNRHISTPSLGLRHQLQALVDSGARPNLVVAGAKAAIADAKKQNEENTEKNKKSNMADNAAQNKRKFEEQMNETRQIHQAVQNGEMSKKVGDQKIRKIFGLSTDEIAQRGIIYPLGGCCNYAPCCFPDGCCPDGCCPDGCCPNGCVGEQFKGCCMSIKGRPPWNAYAASTESQSALDTSTVFHSMLEAILGDANGASDEEKVDALKGLLEKTDEIAKDHQETMKESGNNDASETTHLLHEMANQNTDMKGGCVIL